MAYEHIAVLKALAQGFYDVNRAVLPACAAHCHGDVAAVFQVYARQPFVHEGGDVVYHGLHLWVVCKILLYRRVFAC